jgi:hypothetical protein
MTTTARRARSPRWANGTLMARKINNSQDEAKLQAQDSGPELGGNMWSG